jgi:molybdopterin synthase catalytic subunit
LPAVEVSSADLLELLALRHPRLAPYLSRLRLAINDELRYDAPPVRAGDVIDVMPPVAGGAPEHSLARLFRVFVGRRRFAAAPDAWVELAESRGRVGLLYTPLSVDEAMRCVSNPAAGGIAIFVGVVRNHAEGRAVDRLDYEAHDKLALRELENVANEVLREQPEVRACAVHRVGNLAIGDLAVVVAASAPHRAEAFTACRALIERIKQRVPIWKKEWAADGSASWVNLSG